MKVLHLTVSSDGVISLWDTYEQAVNVREEVYCKLLLTADQERTLGNMQRYAQVRNLPANQRANK